MSIIFKRQMIYIRQKNFQKKKNDEDSVSKINRQSIVNQLKSKLQQNKQINSIPIEVSSVPQIKQQQFTYNKTISSEQNRHSTNYQHEKYPKQAQKLKGDKNKINYVNTKKRNALNFQKCYDVQIKNITSNPMRKQMEEYIKILQKQNQKLKREATIKNQQRYFSQREYTNQGIQTQKIKQENFSQIFPFLLEGKNIIISTSMELIEYKNQINMILTQERTQSKLQSINQCLQKSQKIITLYQSILNRPQQIQNQEQHSKIYLNDIIEYQRKIIQNLSSSNSTIKSQMHQKNLLRYEINRLNLKCQQLLAKNNELLSKKGCIIFEGKNKKSPIHSKSQYKTPSQNSSYIEHDTPSCSNTHKTHPIEESLQEKIYQLTAQVENLKIQKQYIFDKLNEKITQYEELCNEYELLREKYEESNQIAEVQRQKNEIILKINNELQSKLKQFQRQNQMTKEEQKILSDQISLLKDKIKHLESRGQNKSLKIDHQNGSKGCATIEDFFAFLNKNNLRQYHKTLIDLIQNYEQKISELNISYIDQKALKDRHISFCTNIYRLANSRLSSEVLIREVLKYDEILELINDNEIDICLRQIKCLSIGIDNSELAIIHEELKSYIIDLKSRLPALKQQYLQEGSSVADSYYQSIEKFQDFQEN